MLAFVRQDLLRAPAFLIPLAVFGSGQPSPKMVRMAPGVSHGDDQHLFAIGYECKVIGKSRQIDPAISRRTLPLEERMLDNRRAGTFNLTTKPDTETDRASLVVARSALEFGDCFRQRSNRKTHRSGAICRSLAKTSPAGMGFDSPEVNALMRRAISASQATSAPGCGSRSTLSSS